VQCEETATRTRDLPVTGGKTLPLAPASPFKKKIKAKAKITMQGSLLQYLHLTTQEYSLHFYSTKKISRAQYEGKNKPEDDLQVEPFS